MTFDDFWSFTRGKMGQQKRQYLQVQWSMTMRLSSSTAMESQPAIIIIVLDGSNYF